MPLDGLSMDGDQGWHYPMQPDRRVLEQKGVLQRTCRKGNCLDNAVMVNFFGIPRSELCYVKKYTSVQVLKTDFQADIETITMPGSTSN